MAVKRALAALGGLLLAMAIAAPAQATTHAIARDRVIGADVYGWRWASTAITVSDQTAGWHPAVAQAVANWNARSTVHLNYTTSPCTGCITVSEVSYIPCSTCGTNSYIAGLADTTVTGGYAVNSQIQLSDLTPASRTAARVHIAVHEIGHTLGLAHVTWTTRTVMYPTFDMYDPHLLTKPTSVDWKNLGGLYR